MRKYVSQKIEHMQPSGIRAFFDLVLGMKDVVSLGVGEPDFVTPWQIREAGIYSLEQGFTSYTSNKGLYKLRLSLHRFLKSRYGLDYSPEDEILITVGVSEGLDLAVRSIVEPQDKVLIPTPCYVSYGPVVEMAGGVAVFIDTSKDNFKLTPRALEKNIDKHTKALILNYPTNPTGVSYTKKELLALNDVLQRYGILCISDEVYDMLSYDFEHTPFPTLPKAKPRTVYLNGFSKGYAMTGWRIGYACGPKDIISAMTKIHQYTIMCVSITSQMAACEALVSGVAAAQEMKHEYQKRREFFIAGLNRIGLSCVKPQGAFYAFASVKNTGLSSMDFSRKLLEREKVAVVPGNAFGENGEGFVRMSYASGIDNLKEALLRIERFLKTKGRCNNG